MRSLRSLKPLLLLFFFGFSWPVLHAQDTLCIIQSIEIKGNRVTRPPIILREVEFKPGDTLSCEGIRLHIKQSESNLMNTTLFNFAELSLEEVMDKERQPANQSIPVKFYHCRVNVVERWYTWPFPVVILNERNFNTWWETRDFDEITYGFVLQRNNFRGRREKLHLTLMYGYNQTLGITYENPNVNFKKTLGFSYSLFYTRNHSSAYSSYNNEELSVKLKDEFVRQNLKAQVKLTYRPQIHHYHSLSITYQRFDFMDTLLTLNPGFSINQMTEADFFQINYRWKADFRDYQPYPLKGYYVDFEIEKTGLNLVEDPVHDFVQIKASVRKYLKLEDRWHVSSGLTAKTYIGKNIPYFLQKGLGFDNDFVRGFEYYVVDGQQYALLRNNLKWTLLPRRVNQIPFIKNQRFGLIHYALYLGIHVDLARVSDNNLYNANKLANRWISGYGLGLDLVTYYDKVFRLEFSRNQYGENGMYLHFVAPI